MKQTVEAFALYQSKKTLPTPLNDDEDIQLIRERVVSHEDAEEEPEVAKEEAINYRSCHVERSVDVGKTAVYSASCLN